MQGRSQRGGLSGGRRGFGGPSDRGGNKPTGAGGMTPGRGPGGVMVAGATPDPIGGVAIGGTTAGFAGQPPAGGGGGQSLQDLFAAQQPPAQGITTIPNLPTIPTNEELMEMMNQTPFGPPTEPNTALSQYMDLPYGYADYFGYINPLDEDNEPAYVGNQNTIESGETYGLGSFPVGEGILTVDPPGLSELMKGKPSLGVNYSFPIDFLK